MSEPTIPPPPPSYAPPPPPPPPMMGSGGGAVSPNRTVMIVLSYLSILFLIPLLTEKEDREVQWHAKHGAVLTVAEIALGIAASILMVVLNMIHLGCIGCVISLLYPCICIVILVVHILCIVKGINGQRFIIPGLSQYADRF